MVEYTFSQGQPSPMGATPDTGGVNFSVFSEYAENIVLCLFDESGQIETQRIPLSKGDAYCWHVYVEGLRAGALYGYRVFGKYDPSSGFRFNPNKVLIDPYARGLDREFQWHDSFYAYTDKNDSEEWGYSETDSAAYIPKAVVCEKRSVSQIEAIQQSKPNTPWSDTVIYETHVKGFSKLNPNIPASLRGTYAGLAHEQSIQYLKGLGVTAVELLPVHQFIDEQFLVDRELTNYWGYNTLSFFIAHDAYEASEKKDEFLMMVERLHAEGIEVILDVVYNHTSESNQFGPHLSFRGFDNLNYYRLESDRPQAYVNDTGCGNTLRVDHPKVMQLILDSLRFWAGEMGVDGFRFDLASILGRDHAGFDRRSAFFQAISQDPLLSKCKLIAEPWDIGPGGYQLGAYPEEWSEWNDQFRDTCRRYWRGDKGMLPNFARRIHGSSDIFEHSGRHPRSSVNFVCSHDGFTLADLVSYKERHNLANKEDNRDGHSENLSENYGAEGSTHSQKILDIRARQHRNFLATTLLSQGTPMLQCGDEMGKSQSGNNNAYCQDNELNWLPWLSLSDRHHQLISFTRNVISIRKTYSILRNLHYVHFPDRYAIEHKCSRWVNSDGQSMEDADWHSEKNIALGWILERDDENEHRILLFLFNASSEDVHFQLPREKDISAWEVLLDTFFPEGKSEKKHFQAQESVLLRNKSLILLSTIVAEKK